MVMGTSVFLSHVAPPWVEGERQPLIFRLPASAEAPGEVSPKRASVAHSARRRQGGSHKEFHDSACAGSLRASMSSITDCRSAGSGESKSTLLPSRGCVKDNRAECRNGRSRRITARR